jgi:glutathione S-transferase
MALKLFDLAGADPQVRFSPYCWRVRMALAHKGLGVETIPWRYSDKDKIAFSGQGLVPVLVDGERVVTDSWKIALYLDETYPEPALFADRQHRGEAFFVKSWTEKTLHPAIARIILLDVYYLLHPNDRAYFRQTREQRYGVTLENFVADKEKNIAALRKLVEPLRAGLAEYPFLAGERPGFTDYIVFGAFQWAKKASTAALLESDDPVVEWIDRLRGMYSDLIGSG